MSEFELLLHEDRREQASLLSKEGSSGKKVEYLGEVDSTFICLGNWRGVECEDDLGQGQISLQTGSHDAWGKDVGLRTGKEVIASRSKGTSVGKEPGTVSSKILKQSGQKCLKEVDASGISGCCGAVGVGDEGEDSSDSLPDHLLIEVLVRLAVTDWPAAACVKKRWAAMFQGDGLWQTALIKRWPQAGGGKRWPGPIGRGSSKTDIGVGRRYTALHMSNSLFTRDNADGDVDEVAGHVYLYLKEQLELGTPSLSYGLLHGTIIDQFLACGKKSDEAHDLASQIWVAVLDNLDESECTFHLLMRIAEEWEVFLPYPYSKSHAVQWRLFERLFTDFRDCLSQFDYFDVLTRAKHKFELIPPTWLGY